MNRGTSLFIFLLLVSAACFSQSAKYPRGYFRSPIGMPFELSSNFGALRPNHWHMGLDIRTNQKENIPVSAAAEGYISFVGIRPQSFGRFIIINHPNGYSTLYAHLNDFSPALEQYVTEQQYEQESWAVELNIAPDKFKVRQGQFIAYSGNTGASQGPHLHFEIFDTKTEKRFNPLLFGFPIQDWKAPIITRLALYDRAMSIYQQSPTLFSIKKTGFTYSIAATSLLEVSSPKISFAIGAQDLMDNLGFAFGIYTAEMYLDNTLITRFALDSIDYTETRCINAHIDYKTKSGGGAYLQHLSPLPGDISQVYTIANEDGIIHLPDTAIHTVAIRVADAYNNSSILYFSVQYKMPTDRPVKSDKEVSFLPNQENNLLLPDFDMQLSKQSVYDTVKIKYYQFPATASNAISNMHRVNDNRTPLQEPALVRIKTTKEILPVWKDKIVIKNSGDGIGFRKAEWGNLTYQKWATATFAQLGSYEVLIDAQPPIINELGAADTVVFSKSNEIVFSPADNTAIRNFRAELNGRWLRFTNDKGRKWIYRFDDQCPYGVYHLRVAVTDIVGNKTVKEWWFKREPYTPPVKKVSVKKKKTKKKN